MFKNKKLRSAAHILLPLLGVLGFGIVMALLTSGTDIALLNPKGYIANQQHWLFITSTLIMLGFGVPVIATVYFFIWKYRDGSPSAPYSPDTKVSKAFLVFAWGGPLIIVLILASLMLPATQKLHPGDAIVSNNDQITIQVVALNWKWLFMYPDHDIATVNFVQIPVDTPVRFELTADEAPMNSFWIPHLGGMLYAMTGHVNPLNLISDTEGDYQGGAAEINGRGLAGMRFNTHVSSKTDFDNWVTGTRETAPSLDSATYAALLKPSENNTPAYYSHPDPELFSRIVSKYNQDHQHDSQSQETH